MKNKTEILETLTPCEGQRVRLNRTEYWAGSTMVIEPGMFGNNSRVGAPGVPAGEEGTVYKEGDNRFRFVPDIVGVKTGWVLRFTSLGVDIFDFI